MSDPLSINLLLGKPADEVSLNCPGSYNTDPWYIRYVGANSGNPATATYYSTGHDRIYSEDMAVDGLGNIYTVGNFDQDRNFNFQGCIQKFASDGSIIWRENIRIEVDEGGSVIEDGTWLTGYSVTIDSEGSAYVACQGTIQSATHGNYDRSMIIKYNCEGTREWVKFFKDPTGMGGDTIFVKLRYYNNALWLTGVMNWGVGILTKLDLSGNILISKPFGDSGALAELWPNTLNFDPAGNLVISAGDQSYANLHLFKFDQSLNNLWVKSYDFETNHNGTSQLENGVAIKADGTIYITQSSGDSLTQVIAVDSDGDLLWANSYGMGMSYQFDVVHPRVAIDDSNTLMLIATIDTQESVWSTVLRLDSTGNILSERTFNEGGTHGLDHYRPTQATVRDNLLYMAYSDAMSGWNRFSYHAIMKIPVNPSQDLSFGGKVTYYAPTEPLLTMSMTPSSILEITAGPYVWDFNWSTDTFVPTVDTILYPTDATAWCAPEVLELDAPIANDGNSWVGVIALQDYSTDWWQAFRGSDVDNSGNIYASGYLHHPGASIDSISLFKISPSGTILFQQDYQPTANVRDLHLVCDGSGNVYQLYKLFNTTFQLIKYNNSGVIQWQKTWTVSSSSVNNLVLVSDGLLICSEISGNARMMKFDFNGNVVWTRNVSQSGTTAPEFMSVVEVSDGYVWTGSANYGTSAGGLSFETWLNKTSKDGQTYSWQRVIGSTTTSYLSQESGYGLLKDGSDNFYVYGTTNSGAGVSNNAYRLAIHKYNSSGVHQWSKQYYDVSGISPNQSYSNQVFSMSDDGYIYNHIILYPLGAGSWEPFNAALICKWDLDGNFIWGKRIDSNGWAPDDWTIRIKGNYLYITGGMQSEMVPSIVMKLDLTTMPAGDFARGRWFFRDYQMTQSSITVNDRATTLTNVSATVTPTNTAYTPVAVSSVITMNKRNLS